MTKRSPIAMARQLRALAARDEGFTHADLAPCYVMAAEGLEALQAFKEYVHKRLDDAGVPTNPDGPHSKEGCRIGDRLDLVLAANGSATEGDKQKAADVPTVTLDDNLTASSRDDETTGETRK